MGIRPIEGQEWTTTLLPRTFLTSGKTVRNGLLGDPGMLDDSGPSACHSQRGVNGIASGGGAVAVEEPAEIEADQEKHKVDRPAHATQFR